MTENLSKKELASKLGISRASLYYQPKQPVKDIRLKHKILKTLSQYPSYGHRRIANQLNINKKRALRVMQLFKIRPYRRRAKRLKKKQDEGLKPSVYPNLIESYYPNKANTVWASDFTYLNYKGRWIYLATIIDIYSREIVGWSILTSHTVKLVLEALIDALVKKKNSPQILHSDQGKEYTSRNYLNLIELMNIKVSMSRKRSPWENGYQESFYSQFKVDLGDPSRFETLGELIENIHLAIFKYNLLRIHTKLKTSPFQYLQQEENKNTLSEKPNLLLKQPLDFVLDCVS